MFTGLIEETGRLLDARPFAGGRRLRIGAPRLAAELRTGDSVACHGVCLTVEAIDARAGDFTVAAVAETLRRTTAEEWRRGMRLHLERALRADGRLGGHIVQGHVDGCGRVLRAGRRGAAWVLAIRLPAGLERYVVAKGSLAVDGVSLTVGERRGGLVEAHLIPETLARTELGRLRPGARVNLEIDILAKYAESLLPGREPGGERDPQERAAW